MPNVYFEASNASLASAVSVKKVYYSFSNDHFLKRLDFEKNRPGVSVGVGGPKL